jgi:ParB/RepB/Spo0J family partition protein
MGGVANEPLGSEGRQVADLRHEAIETKRLHPNPWNPNRMDERTLAAEIQSIQTYGFIDPVTVRPHPEVEDGFQIIDGEHRWKVAVDLEIDPIPCVVLDLSDTAARKLTIILNETRGRADDVMLGTLLAELQEAEGPDALSNALPYDPNEIAHLLAMADADWSNFDPDPGANDPGSGSGDDDDEWKTIACRVPADFVQTWTEAERQVRAARDGLHDDERIANGQVLEILVAEYLSRLTA